MAKPKTPIEAFLTPLTKLALKQPEIEAEVIWAENGAWQPQDDDAEFLDGEEVPYYAEGLLLEGFSLHYQILAEADAPKDAVHIRLFCWQAVPPAMPDAGDGLVIAASGQMAGQQPS